MALSLILRNASKLQAKALQNFSKSTSFVITKDFSPHHKHYSTLNKNSVNLTLVVPSSKILASAQGRLMSSDHSRMWPLEKAITLSLIALLPAAIAAPHPVLDNFLAVAAVAHFHWGLEAVVTDYARPIVLGSILPKLALLLLYIISATTLGALIYYNVNDIGIGETIRRFWNIKHVEEAVGEDGPPSEEAPEK